MAAPFIQEDVPGRIVAPPTTVTTRPAERSLSTPLTLPFAP